eukprot:GHVQ01041854.1.p1 GENE.GHVQ01041854.1~~GHVQ01041854.1.p1  ORF type:complete len:1327 (+),score=167.69 GHVQ01041854.1:546-3983(+)
MNFLYPPKQLRTGELPRWLSPNYFLITRKGGINDHAVLLCSCLLGMKYEAFVCKGTINDGESEHVWVATRHSQGYVVFWETTTKTKYILPARWGYPKQKPPDAEGVKADVAPQGEYNPYWDGAYLEAWQCWAAQQYDITNYLASYEGKQAHVEEPEIRFDSELDEYWEGQDYLDEAQEQAGVDSTSSAEAVKLDKAMMRKILQDELSSLPITPNKALLDPDTTLAFVPYSSIEVMFNNHQLWGNLQNHHPACITYDVEDEWKWRPFLFDTPTSIDSDVLIAPPTRDRTCDLISETVASDIAESIRLHRARMGLDSHFDFTEDMFARLEKYLDLLEYRLHLDPALDPGPPEGHEAWSAWGKWDNAETQTADNQDTYIRAGSKSESRKATEYGGEAWKQFEGEADVEATKEKTFNTQPKVVTNIAASPGAAAKAPPATLSPNPVHFQRDPVHNAELPRAHSNQRAKHHVRWRRGGQPMGRIRPRPRRLANFRRRVTAATCGGSRYPDNSSWEWVSETHLESSSSSNHPDSDSDCLTDFDRKTVRSDKQRGFCTTGDVNRMQRLSSGAVMELCPTRPHGVLKGVQTEAPQERTAKEQLELGNWVLDGDVSYSVTRVIDRMQRTGTNKHNAPNGQDRATVATTTSSSNEKRIANRDISGKASVRLQTESDDPWRYSFPRMHGSAGVGGNVRDEVESYGLGAESRGTGFYNIFQCVRPLRSNRKSYEEELQRERDARRQLTDQLKSRPAHACESLSNHDVVTVSDDSSADQEANSSSHSEAADTDSMRLSQTQPAPVTASEISSMSPTVDTSITGSHIAANTPSGDYTSSVPNIRPSPGFQFRSTCHHSMMLDYDDFPMSPRLPRDHGAAPPAPLSPSAGAATTGLAAESQAQQTHYHGTEGDGGGTYWYGEEAEMPEQEHEGQQYDAAQHEGPEPWKRTVEPDDEFYSELLKPPPQASPEYMAYDGGIDVAELGFDTPKSRKKGRVKKRYVAEWGKELPEPEPEEAKKETTHVPTAWELPQTSKKYVADQQAKWNWYYRMEALYYVWQRYRFPVAANHTFTGFPLHFSTTDTSEIRGYLMGAKRFRKFIEISIDNIIYIPLCKVYPLMGGVVSTWLFLGCSIPWMTERERDTRMRRPRKARRRRRRRRR